MKTKSLPMMRKGKCADYSWKKKPLICRGHSMITSCLNPYKSRRSNRPLKQKASKTDPASRKISTIECSLVLHQKIFTTVLTTSNLSWMESNQGRRSPITISYLSSKGGSQTLVEESTLPNRSISSTKALISLARFLVQRDSFQGLNQSTIWNTSTILPAISNSRAMSNLPCRSNNPISWLGLNRSNTKSRTLMLDLGLT